MGRVRPLVCVIMLEKPFLHPQHKRLASSEQTARHPPDYDMDGPTMGRAPNQQRGPYGAAREGTPGVVPARSNPLTSPRAVAANAEQQSPPPLAAVTPRPPMAGSFAYRDEVLTELLEEDARTAPSLPIVLLSAAFGIAAGVITFYIAYTLALLRVEVSVALAVLALCIAVGATGALVSATTGSTAALPTIGLSCALIVITFIVLGLCMVMGAFAATLFIVVGA